MKPLVSVEFITYNHAKYIRQSLDGVLMQKTNFPLEIVIGEDCSTDGTREIVNEYQQRFPDIIRIITDEKNVGPQANVIRTLKACRGKYIAALEGDDYWDDPLKLQKQVDFLEKNENYSAVCTNVYRRIEETGEQVIDQRLNQKENEDIDLITLHKRHPCIYTPTFLFRNDAFTHYDWLHDSIAGDIVVFSSCALKGPIRYMVDFTTVYRSHLASASHVNNKNITALWKNHIELLNRLDKESSFRFATEFAKIKRKYTRFIELSSSDFTVRKLLTGINYFLFDTKRTIRDLKNTTLLLLPFLQKKN